MTSKNFSSKLFDIKLIMLHFRKVIWLPTLAMIGFFFSLPVATALLMQDMTRQLAHMPKDRIEYIINNCIDNVLSFNQGFTIFLVSVGAVMAAATVFRFLHNRKQIDFYHSMPIKREKLFFTQCIVAFLMFLIPYIIGTFLNIVVIFTFGGAEHMLWGVYFYNILINIIFFLTIFAVATLAIMLSGTTIISLKLTGILLFIGPATALLFSGFKSIFYRYNYGELFDLEKYAINSSPLFKYIFSSFSGTGYSLQGMGYLWVILFTVAVFAFSFWLYKIRSSECAGKALAFNKSKLIIKLPIVALCSMGFAFLFYGLGSSSIWLYFGAIIGGLLVSQFLEIVYTSDFKAIKKGIPASLIAIALVCVVISIGKFDLTKFDQYVPSPDEVASVNIIMEGIDSYGQSNYYEQPDKPNATFTDRELYNLNKFSLSEPGSIQGVIDICTNTIAEDNAIIEKQNSYDVYSMEPELSNNPYIDYQSTTFKVVYNLKNGKQVARRYYSVIPSQQPDAFKAILADKSYRENYFSLYKQDLSQVFVETAHNFQNNNVTLLKDDIAKQKQIIETYITEHKKLSADTISKEMPVGEITFRVYTDKDNLPTDIQGLFDKERQHSSYSNYNYPIYADFTQTIALIQGANSKISFVNNLDNLTKIEIHTNTNSDDTYTYEETKEFGNGTITVEKNQESTINITDVTNPAEMMAIINSTYNENAITYNPFVVKDTSRSFRCMYTNYGEATRYSLGDPEKISQ